MNARHSWMFCHAAFADGKMLLLPSSLLLLCSEAVYVVPPGQQGGSSQLSPTFSLLLGKEINLERLSFFSFPWVAKYIQEEVLVGVLNWGTDILVSSLQFWHLGISNVFSITPLKGKVEFILWHSELQEDLSLKPLHTRKLPLISLTDLPTLQLYDQTLHKLPCQSNQTLALLEDS